MQHATQVWIARRGPDNTCFDNTVHCFIYRVDPHKGLVQSGGLTARFKRFIPMSLFSYTIHNLGLESPSRWACSTEALTTCAGLLSFISTSPFSLLHFYNGFRFKCWVGRLTSSKCLFQSHCSHFSVHNLGVDSMIKVVLSPEKCKRHV